MEFTIPKTPPRKLQKARPFPVMESSNSMETEELMNEEGEGEEEENSFDDEKENNDETETSIQVEHQTSINNPKSMTPQPSARASDNIDSNDDNSPTFKEKISKLYSCVPEIASHFTILRRIGEGTFSSVYLAKLKHHPAIQQMFALKHIIPTSHPLRIENELKCLLEIGGCDNVMGVKMCVRNRDHVVIVMPYFPHIKFQDCLFQMTVEEGREYMRNLLIALKRVHKFDVIHRDIKPANFLYNRETKEYALVDFGLASGPFLVEPSKMASYKSSSSSSQHANRTSTPASFTTTTMTTTSTTPKTPPSSSFHQTSSSLKPVTTSNSTHYVLSSSSASALVKTKTGGGNTATTAATSTRNASAAASSSLLSRSITIATPTTTKTSTRSPSSRQPLSPLKRGDVSSVRTAHKGGVIKLHQRRETSLTPAATRMFAPSFASVSSSLLRQRSGLCDCYGKPVICELCVARNMQVAPRAGTAGFRSPEVLLKCPNQGPAVDIWSAGVIFLSMLSARYPFFKANDDLGYMAQIISLLGTHLCKQAANSFGKSLTLSENIPPCDMHLVCEKLRHTQIVSGPSFGLPQPLPQQQQVPPPQQQQLPPPQQQQQQLSPQHQQQQHPSRQQQQKEEEEEPSPEQQQQQPSTAASSAAANPSTPTTTTTPATTASSTPDSEDDSAILAILDSWSEISPHAYNLLKRLLDPNPKTRITAKDALHHPFFKVETDEAGDCPSSDTKTKPKTTSDSDAHVNAMPATSASTKGRRQQQDSIVNNDKNATSNNTSAASAPKTVSCPSK